MAPASLVVAAPVLPTLSNVVAYVEDADRTLRPQVMLLDLLTRRRFVVVPQSTDARVSYFHPDISPDLSRVAVSTDRGDFARARIAVKQIFGGSLEDVTSPPPGARDLAPVWAPDGTRILFVRQTDQGLSLHVVDLGDRSVRSVPNTDGAQSADWDPTGARIVFAATPPPGARDGDLVVVNADGSGLRSLNTRGSRPSWDPRGDLVAYSFTESVDPDSFSPEGRPVRLIATVSTTTGFVDRYNGTRPTAARTAADNPRWAPDGASILFDLHGYWIDDMWTPRELWGVDRGDARAAAVLSGTSDKALGSVVGPALPDVAAGVRSGFNPVRPVRLLDTRSRSMGVSAGAPLRLPLRGVPTSSGAIPTDATAVALTVTVTQPSYATDVRVYPTGSAVPDVSNLNARAGATVANVVIVPVGEDGSVSLLVSAGEAHLVVDLAGYYTPTPSGLGTTTVAQTRIFDSREGQIPRDSAKGAVGAAGHVDVDVTGTFVSSDGASSVLVPDSARAVVVNVTATGATADTVVRAYPSSSNPEVPVVSNLNLRRGQTRATLAVVAVGDGGRIRLRNNSGSVHLVVDVAGYFDASSTGAFVPVTPTRFVDTRAGIGAAPIKTGPGAGSLVGVNLHVAGQRGIPPGATAVVFNLTGTEPDRGTHFSVFVPTGKVGPAISNLNLGLDQTHANLVLSRLGTNGATRIINYAGSAHMIADVAGFIEG